MLFALQLGKGYLFYSWANVIYSTAGIMLFVLQHGKCYLFYSMGNVICFKAGEMLFILQHGKCYLFYIWGNVICFTEWEMWFVLKLGKCYSFCSWGNVICFTAGEMLLVLQLGKCYFFAAGETHFPLVKVTTAVLSRETPIILLLNKSHPMVPSGVLGLSDQSLVELWAGDISLYRETAPTILWCSTIRVL